MKKLIYYKEFDSELGCMYYFVKDAEDDFYWEGPEHDPELAEIRNDYELVEVEEGVFYSEDEGDADTCLEEMAYCDGC